MVKSSRGNADEPDAQWAVFYLLGRLSAGYPQPAEKRTELNDQYDPEADPTS